MGVRKKYGGSGKDCTTLAIGVKQYSELKPLKGYPIHTPFNTLDEIKDYLAGEKIICLLCGHDYRLLVNHLRTKHAMGRDEYNKKYGIPKTWALCGESVSRVASDRMKSRLQDESFLRKNNEFIKSFQGKRDYKKIDRVPAFINHLRKLNEDKSLEHKKVLQANHENNKGE